MRKRNPHLILIFTATLPMPGDTRLQIKNTGFRAGFLSRLAEEIPQVEFSKPGKRLLKPGGVAMEFFTQEGALNKWGLEQISRGLQAKFTCTRLRQKSDQLFG